MELQWLGGPTFVLRVGAHVVLSDPMFAEGPRAFIMNGHPSTGEDGAAIVRHAPLPPFDVASVTLVLVSHLHSDHFDREAAERLDKRLPIIAPAAQRDRLQQWGFRDVRGLGWWQRIALTQGGNLLGIRAVPARHSADDTVDRELGVVNGYVIEDGKSGRRMYWTGDTVWFDGLNEIRRRVPRVDAVVPHMGAVGRDGPWGRMTLDAVEALRLLELFAESVCVPIHHHTFSHYVEPVDALVQAAAGVATAERLRVLLEGETIVV